MKPSIIERALQLAAESQSVDEVRRKVRSDELTTYVTGPSAVYLDITNASAEDIRRA